MDDELFKLEAELKRLRPAGPSRELLLRLDAELAPAAAARRASAVRRGRAWWVWAGALPIAAALAVAWVVNTRRPPIAPNQGLVAADASVSTTATEVVFKPVSAENVLYAVVPAGRQTGDRQGETGEARRAEDDVDDVQPSPARPGRHGVRRAKFRFPPRRGIGEF